MSDDAIESRLQLALAIAREAGNVTLRYFRQASLAVDLKSDQSPVTVADREAEQLLRRRIAAAFPADAILGEEFGEQAGTSGYRWILDPIDGTKSFICGVPLYGTLIGVEHTAIQASGERQPPESSAAQSLLGVIHIPALGETVYAKRGGGAWYTDGKGAPQPARVSSRRSLAEGLFCTSQVDSFTKRGSADVFDRLQAAARITRTWGDCYGYLLVVTGRAELMVDPIMSVWDAAALQPILEAAGGTFTDWKGAPTIYSGEGLATNGLVKDETLRLLTP